MKNHKQTTLDLNGPILSFTTNPVGAIGIGTTIGSIGGGSVTLTGIATATFTSIGTITNPATNTGFITYRWYEVGVGALGDSTYVTGTATTSLTLSNLITPTDNGREFYLVADYVPSAYSQPSGSPVTAGTARSTGNAINDPVSSGIGTIVVLPRLEIISQPSSTSALLNQNKTITVVAGLTDNLFPNDLTYQWYWDGVPVNDGTITTYETTTTVVSSTPTTVTSNVTEDRTFFNNETLTLQPTSRNIQITIAGASGGNGGSDASGVGGAGGAGRRGTFSYKDGGATLSLYVGKRGNDGASNTRGGTGGGAGGAGGTYRAGAAGGNTGPGSGTSGGISGGGGGGGGASVVLDSRKSGSERTIMAAGGGGGGGGSWNIEGLPGDFGGGFTTGGSIDSLNNAKAGDSASVDGGGGGGQGGGTVPNTSRTQNGRAGKDRTNGTALDGISAEGGRMMFSGVDPAYATILPPGGTLHTGDGFINVKWTWTLTSTASGSTTTTTQQVPRNIVLSGTKTPTLTVRSDKVGINTAICLVSSATAGMSIFTDIINFSSLSTADQYNIQIEAINNNDTASISTINLSNGEYVFNSNSTTQSGVIPVLYSFYSSDRDIDLEMDLYGGKGSNVGSYIGGEGGFSRIQFTLRRNTEYVIAGLVDGVNAPFIYRKGSLIACAGAGGDAGISAKGGFGGGIGIAGQTGFGRDGGTGGFAIAAGTLSANGIFGSATTLTATSPDTKATSPNGGRVLPCARGVYYRQQGLSACSDIGTTQFRISDGTTLTNTGSITRGYKAGYSIIETAGASSSNGGLGGAGATGGNGGANGAGGGGGSGYSDGSVTVVNTQLGGSTGPAKVVMRLYVPGPTPTPTSTPTPTPIPCVNQRFESLFVNGYDNAYVIWSGGTRSATGRFIDSANPGAYSIAITSGGGLATTEGALADYIINYYKTNLLRLLDGSGFGYWRSEFINNSKYTSFATLGVDIQAAYNASEKSFGTPITYSSCNTRVY